MKRTFLPLVGVLLFCNSCDRVRQYFHKATEEVEQMTENRFADPLEFTNVRYCSPDSSVITEADLPVLNGSVLGDSIFEFIEGEFPGLADAYIEGNTDLANAFRRMGEGLYRNINMQKDELRADYDEEGIPEYMLEWTFEKHVTVTYDTPRYITYLDEMAEYTGGAHGMSYAFGTTFDKSTGQRVDKSILKDETDPNFKAIFQSELLKYFTDGEDYGNATLEDFLLINIDALELGNISLTDKSVVFRYQPYEIAPYAAGRPEVQLTFEQVRPYLSKKGLALTGQ